MVVSGSACLRRISIDVTTAFCDEFPAVEGIGKVFGAMVPHAEEDCHSTRFGSSGDGRGL